MINRFNFYFLLMAMLFVTANCNEKNTTTGDYLRVSGNTELQFDGKESQRMLKVETNLTFTAKSSDESWCTATTRPGQVFNLVINVAENGGTDERTAYVTLTAPGLEIVEVKVVQQALIPAVKIVNQNGEFHLMISGKETYLKGVNLHFPTAEQVALAAACGANAARIFCHPTDIEYTLPTIDWAVQQKMHVTPCWNFLSQNTADYTEAYKTTRKAQVKDFAERLKDIPNVFMIVVGNELDHSSGNTNTDAIYQFVNELALIVKSICPDKLVSTAICSTTNNETCNRIARCAPDLDLLCIQCYGTMMPWVDNLVKSSNWKGAYIITEWGVDGPWAPKATTSWGAKVEPTSEEKRALLVKRYENDFKTKLPRCLGSFFFLWSSHWEPTPTWFDAFVESVATVGLNRESTPIVEALQQSWSGVTPTQTAPVVTDIYIDNIKPSAAANYGRVNSGMAFTTSVDAGSKNGKTLTYKWEILKDTDKSARPGIVQTTSVNTLTTTITEKGDYRVYVYVLDGTGRVGTANAPFRVQ